VKSLTAFSHFILQDLGDRCSISTSRDQKTVTARVNHEGLSFLTITLPDFAKDFQKSLSQGRVDHTMFPSFRKHGGLPQFLGGFLDLVFDRKTGLLLNKPSIDAILAIRQFSMLFGKMEGECTSARTSAAMNGFIECERELHFSDSNIDSNLVADFIRVGSVLFRDVFSSVDRKIHEGELIPKHGPGATAEKLSSNSKYSNSEWTERLESVFPFGENLFPNFGWYQSFQSVKLHEPGQERPVRVVPVPKTMKTPRIIAIEPACMQYMQQAILEALTDGVQRVDHLRNILGNLDQEPNRFLARVGSRNGSLATLDLSEASDRVSNQYVRALLSRWSLLQEAVEATRSRKADVPGYGIIRLSKFASMGSALCFAFEGFVFTTIIFMAIEKELNKPVSTKLIKSFVGRVRVYGDDIIVPVDMVGRVITLLEAFGLKVNVDKSFWTGKFRESCGGDFYDGHDVTPIRVRRRIPWSHKHIDEIVSTVSLRNQLYDAGYVKSVEFLDGKLTSVLPVFPKVPRNSPALGRWTSQTIIAERFSPDLHKPQIKACVTKARIPSDLLDDYGALMKWFLKRSGLPIADRDHLLYAGRPVSVDIKTRWLSAI